MCPVRGPDSGRYDPANPVNHDETSKDVDWGEGYQESFRRLASQFGKAPSYSPVPDQDSDHESSTNQITRTNSSHAASHGRGRARPSANTVSPLHYLPTEIVQDIATRLDSDLDLTAMMRTGSTLHSILHPDGANCIWRQRFLARYDYPRLESNLEFPFAYKVRQLVLRGFDSFAIGYSLKQRSGHQLDVIKDMVLETYNALEPHDAPIYSKNLAIFGSRNPPAWLIKLMSCSLYGSEKRKHGQPNFLFDTVQVTLSHLVLSPKSPILARIPSSRDNYDLVKVYNFNKPFATLLEVLEEEELEETPPPFASSRFPNLKSPSPTPEPEEPRYRLNAHALLHIRNFWQRHFTDGMHGVGENTYVSVVKSLSASGMGPREWDQPLQNQIPFHTNWCGHYSCLHPWPKNRQDLEERQSCAEDWEAVDPITLDLETSMSNDDQAFWPPAFSSISAFANLVPDLSFAKEWNVTYLRGIAPFQESKSPSINVAESAEKFPKWHPYLALRVSGFVHDIPNETLIDEDAQERRVDAYDDENDFEADRPIPGWKHIVMVMWKPTTRYLSTVLEHAEEEYGGASDTQISADFNTANIWSGTNTNNGIASASSPASPDSIAQSAANASTTNDAHYMNTTATNATTTQPTESTIDAQYSLHLKKRITSFSKKYTDLLASQASQHNRSLLSDGFAKSTFIPPPTPKSEDPLPPLFSPIHIRTLEDSFSALQYLDWEDGTIDYAYAYEGIIIPGGKIMMGRWWRVHGTEGLGAGREIGPDGIGVEVRPVQSGRLTNSGDGDDSGSGTTSGSSSGTKGKSKAKTKSKKSKKMGKKDARSEGRRRSMRSRGKKRKASALESDDDDNDEGEEFVDSEVEGIEEVEREYEFVTVFNGEESRVVNACKGLERGPFVFWAV